MGMTTWTPHYFHAIIQENKLDSFGHLNNAAYLELLEQARWDWITQGGYGFYKIQETQQGPVLLEAKLTFKRELKARERIVVESQVQSYDGKIGRLMQNIKKEDGSIACAAEMVAGFFDTKARKLIEPSEAWLKALGKN